MSSRDHDSYISDGSLDGLPIASISRCYYILPLKLVYIYITYIKRLKISFFGRIWNFLSARAWSKTGYIF